MSSRERPAVLRYEQNGFHVLSAGAFVLCAVTKERIPLDALRYWNEERQEAYSGPDAATRRLLGQG